MCATGSMLRNIQPGNLIYAPLVNDWAVYENSEDQPLLVEWSKKHAKN